MRKWLAVTGGIGSGKSCVLDILKERGYPVFSCDEIYKEIIQSAGYIQKIEKKFPTCVENGAINRVRLAEMIFQDESNRTALNDIAHPLIMDRLFYLMENCGNEIAFAEVPLLFEGNYEKDFDGVIVILRKREQRINAVALRNKISKEEATARILAQFDYDDESNKIRFENCNAILIENNGDLEELKTKINNLIF